MGIAGKIADRIVNNHHMVVENRLCSRFRTPKSACSRCSDSCPVGAIHVSGKGAEIGGGCTDCGVCISACPNGVFVINGRDDKKMAAEIVSRVRDQELRVFRISCEYGGGTSDLVVPCLGRLTEALLLEPLRAGASRIEILQPPCKECPSRKAAPHTDRVLQQAYYICGMLGIGAIRISLVRLEYEGRRIAKRTNEDSETKSFSRREFFGSLRTKALEVAAASIPEIEQKNAGDKELSFKEAIQIKPVNTKRSMLLESIREMAAKHEGQDSRRADEHPAPCAVEVPSEDCITAGLEVDPKCTACGVCATLCPTGALAQDWSGENYSLKLRPDICTNCHVCTEACMNEAIRIKDVTSLECLLEEADVTLFVATKRRCAVCRMDFVGGGSDICPLCTHIHNKQMAAIQGLFKKGGGCERT